MSIKTLSQNDIGVQVCAASISVTRESSGIYNHNLQIIGQNALNSDEERPNRDIFLHVLAFPDGPFGPPLVTSCRPVQATSDAAKDRLNDEKQPQKRHTSRRDRTSLAKKPIMTSDRSTSFAIVAVTNRHSVVSSIDVASGGIQCSGWDSGFCVPVANMLVPCRNQGSAKSADENAFRGSCKTSGVKLELCSDGNTVALVGKKTLVVFSIKCPQPTLANVVGCGQDLGSEVSNNHIQAIIMPDSTKSCYSLVTGAPDPNVWDADQELGPLGT